MFYQHEDVLWGQDEEDNNKGQMTFSEFSNDLL